MNNQVQELRKRLEWLEEAVSTLAKGLVLLDKQTQLLGFLHDIEMLVAEDYIPEDPEAEEEEEWTEEPTLQAVPCIMQPGIPEHWGKTVECTPERAEYKPRLTKELPRSPDCPHNCPDNCIEWNNKSGCWVCSNCGWSV